MIFPKLNFTEVTSRMQKGRFQALIVGNNHIDRISIVKDVLSKSSITDDSLTIFSLYNDYYENFKVHKTLDYEKLRKIMEFQSSNRHQPHTIVIDGCSVDFKNLTIQQLIFNGGCFLINLIITSTADTIILPQIRCNIDYFFVLNDDSEELNRLNWRYYCGMFPTFELFNQHFQANVLDHQALVVDNIYNGNDLNKMCLHYEISE